MANKGTSYITNPNSIPVTAEGSSIPRNLEDRFAQIYSIKDFGAVGDGVTDDSAAIQAAVDYVASQLYVASPQVSQYGGTLFFPAGEYLVESQIVYSETTNRDMFFGIKGDSSKNTRIICSNPDGFLSITKSNYGLFARVRDIEVRAANASVGSGDNATSSGTAFLFSQADTGNRRDRHIIFENVIICPNNDLSPVDDHWDYGVRIFGGGRALISNTVIYGINKFGRDRSDTWIGQVGLDFLNHYGPLIQNSGMWGFGIGCSYSADTDPGPEGGYFANTVFDSVVGLYVNTPSVNGEPGLTIRDCHCNCGTTGIHVRNKSLIFINDCLLYNETTSEYGPYTDILLENANICKINDVKFHYTSNEDRVNIHALEYTNDVYINNTIHNSLGVGIKLDVGAERIYINEPSFINEYTTHIQDDGATDVHTKSLVDLGCSLTLSADQSIATGTEVDVVWDSTISDEYEWHDSPAATVVVPSGYGIRKIRVTLQSSWGNNSSGYRKIRVTKNNADFTGALKDIRTAQGLTESVCSSLVWDVEEGDVFRVKVSQTSGTAQNFKAGSVVMFEVVDS